MQSGKLRQRVELQEPSGTQSGSGYRKDDYGAYATVWAAVEPLSGREFLEGRMATAEVNTRIRIRYNERVKPEHRVRWGEKLYHVEAVINPETRDREMALMCKRIVSQAREEV